MGDVHRICKDFVDPSFAKLLHDLEGNKVSHKLSPFFTRPAYKYTCAEVGGIGNEK